MVSPELLSHALAGRYTVERELGAGGMATVYLARDQRHDRRVALKVLRPELAAVIGADRFLAEIRTTANLQHPHILPLFDSGRVEPVAGGPAHEVLYYVMPFIEGESLRDRIERDKQLPVGEAIRMATEVASALTYAHRHGVIHRDIKPENILLHDGSALVADFGIALAASKAGGARMTETGMSLGTPQYMSPEQALGERDITARSDIYALGAVTYEMLLGEPPFSGPTAQAIVAKVMTEPPPRIVSRRERVPAHVEEAVLTALEKLPADRFGSAAEFAAALAGGDAPRTRATGTRATGLPSAPAPRRLRLAAVSGFVAGVAIGALAATMWLRRGAVAAEGAGRFEIGTPGLGIDPLHIAALSPDARTIVYHGSGSGGRRALIRRTIDELETRPIVGSEGASNPRFSRDGRELYFSRGGQTYRLTLAGGQAVLVPGTPETPHLAIAGNGDILFEGGDGGVWRAAASGAPVRVTSPDTASGEWRQKVMDVLPGDRWAIYVSSGATGQIGVLQALDLGSGARHRLLPVDVRGAWYAGRGILVYATGDDMLHAIRFDPGPARVQGDAVPLGGPVAVTGVGIARVAVSANGSVLYAPSSPAQLVAVARDGSVRPLLDEARAYHNPRVSPDGRQVSVDITEPGGRDVWVLALDRGTMTRVTFDNDGHDAIWAPDGRALMYISARGGRPAVLRSRLDGSPGEPAVGGTASTPAGWITGGRLVAVGGGVPGAEGWNILADSAGMLRPYIATRFIEGWPATSPDGRWIAYVSNDSRRAEVYLQAVAGGPRVQLSASGGTEPVWSPNGAELFYRTSASAESWLVAARLAIGDSVDILERDTLFALPEIEVAEPHANYSPMAGGGFVMVRRVPEPRLVLIQNVDRVVEEAGRD